MLNRTVVTPRPWSTSRRESSVPAPPSSHASSWTPYRMPCAAPAGDANSAAAATAAAATRARRGIPPRLPPRFALETPETVRVLLVAERAAALPAAPGLAPLHPRRVPHGLVPDVEQEAEEGTCELDQAHDRGHA